MRAPHGTALYQCCQQTTHSRAVCCSTSARPPQPRHAVSTLCTSLTTAPLLTNPPTRVAAAGDDLAVVGGVCATANSIFKRYRGQFSSNALVAELAATQVRPALHCIALHCTAASGTCGAYESSGADR